MDRALQDLRQRYAEPPGFEALAALHHVSYSTLRQQIKRRTGMSPARYLTYLRCSAACRGLTSTAKPIKQIAVDVGYHDSATFSKAFRRTVHVWPQDYRDSRRGMGG